MHHVLVDVRSNARVAEWYLAIACGPTRRVDAFGQSKRFTRRVLWNCRILWAHDSCARHLSVLSLACLDVPIPVCEWR